MQQLLNQIVSGLTSGGIYGSVALALVMIHRSTNLVNFAQGEMAMFSTYIAWLLIQSGLPYWVAFCLTIGASFAGGLAIHWLLMRPLAKAPVLATTIVFIGLLVIFNSVAGWLFTYSIQVFPSPFSGIGIGRGLFSAHDIGSIGVTLVLLVCLYLFFRFTMMGLRMRASAENPMSSRLLGVSVDHMLALGWGLAAAIGAIAGMMVAPVLYLDPNMMSGVLIYAFAAALLGGIDNPFGAVVGGLIVGVLENLLGAYVVGTEVKLTAALVLIVSMLILKPSGIFGSARVARV
jgi:branched-chain amino acid transport system permease protein